MVVNTKPSKTVPVKKGPRAKQSAIAKKNREKVFHPASRKAAQMARTNHKKEKLSDRQRVRSQKQAEQADRYAFFFNELPYDVPCLSLEELHRLVRERWLTRWDADLEQERSLRRKGRPKSTRESELEEFKLRDAEEFRTGLELPDLTDEHNVGLFRQWENADPTFLNILRFIRICGDYPDVMHITRPGRDGVNKGNSKAGEWLVEMEGASPRVGRVGSDMLAMDEIPAREPM